MSVQPTSRSYHFEALLEEIEKAQHSACALQSGLVSKKLQDLIMRVEKEVRACINTLARLSPGANTFALIHIPINESFREIAQVITQIKGNEPPYEKKLEARQAYQIINPLYQKCRPKMGEFNERTWAEYALEIEQEELHGIGETASAFELFLSSIRALVGFEKSFFTNPIVYLFFAHPTDQNEFCVSPPIK